MAMAEGLGDSATRNWWDILAEKLLDHHVKNIIVQEVSQTVVGLLINGVGRQ